MINQSQAYYGPLLLSYGNVHKQINRAKKKLGLSGNEFLILQCFIQAVPRPKYCSDLTASFVPRSRAYFESESGMAQQNVSRSLAGLTAKGALLIFRKKEGCETYYVLSAKFSSAIYSESVFDMSPNFVEKSSDPHQSDVSTHINLMLVPTSICCEYPHQSDVSTHINLMLDPHQSDVSALIEDSLSSLPIPNHPTYPRSNPVVDNVDNSQEPQFHVRRLSNFFASDQLETAVKFCRRIKEPNFQKFDDFLDFLTTRGQYDFDIRSMGAIWGRFFYDEPIDPYRPETISIAQKAN